MACGPTEGNLGRDESSPAAILPVTSLEVLEFGQSAAFRFQGRSGKQYDGGGQVESTGDTCMHTRWAERWEGLWQRSRIAYRKLWRHSSAVQRRLGLGILRATRTGVMKWTVPATGYDSSRVPSHGNKTTEGESRV